ncbi:MAG: hypothetical protein H6719_00755 [Sandaracinaceae bacterium]|nr:hypothetical protein [Sandaracinaceae bacterium]
MSKPAKKEGKAPTYRIPADSPWANAWKMAAGLGALGIAASAVGMFSDTHRFAFSWLFAFMFFLALGLGGLFFVLGQHLTGSGWGVPLRRTAEMLMAGLPVFLILFVPIAVNMHELYPWLEEHGAGHGEEHEGGHGGGHEGGEGHEAGGHEEHGSLLGFGTQAQAQEARDPWDVHPNEREPDTRTHTPEHAAHAEIMESKTWFLDHGLFLVRAGVYFLAWILLAYFFFTWSTRQDKEKGLALTQRMEKTAPFATFVFGFSLTFAAFDWMMSLEPSWYSTIFGVIYFAIAAIIGHAVIILLTLAMRRSGLLREAISVEHFHDIGKLLHGFIVFWAYVSVSQFLLIWYAGIPEESTYYHLRWWGGGGWMNISVVVILAGFVIPFFLLMSRNFKRNLPWLGFSAAWILVVQIGQLYWLVMPYADQTGLVETQLHLHWLDFAAFFAVGGVYMAVVLWNMTRFPLVPVGDPRLDRGLHHEVV